MNPSANQYRRAKQLAEQALKLEPSQRAAWLAEHCNEDDELAAEVAWLLDAAQDDSGDAEPENFQRAARSSLCQISLEAPMPRNYRLLERLDAGGSGVVYRAERVDGATAQQVALKLLAPATALDDALAARFTNEQAALARLNHPNIAHLIDGGLTAEGRPFLATEYVSGQPMDQWCNQQNASLQQRIKLMIKICGAVDYAHRHMVIHRDLKPSNILITADGEPKLLDFGVAELIDGPRSTDKSRAAGGRYMTLAYASPEQAAGDPLSAATDVYSLGVLLHETLTGKRPFDDLASPREVLNALQTRAAPSVGRLQNNTRLRLPADLVAIVDRALAFEPGKRYPTASALAEDLENLLRRRPVTARGGGRLYQMERFVSRHRIGSLTTLGILVLLAGFLVDRERQLRQIAWERDRAEAVTGFMHEMFSGAGSLPSRGNTVTVRELLDLGSERMIDDQALSPDSMASVLLALGRAYNALGLGQQALPLLEQAQLGMTDQASPLDQARVQIDIAAALDTAGWAASAIEADRKAMALLQQAGISDGDEWLALRVRLLRNQANVQDVPLQQTVVELEQIESELSARAAPPAELLFETRAALVALSRTGADAKAVEVFERAARMIETVADRQHYLYRLSISNQASLHLRQSDPEQAERLMIDLLGDSAAPEQPFSTIDATYRAAALDILGSALALQDRLTEAADIYRQALKLLSNNADPSTETLKARLVQLEILAGASNQPGQRQSMRLGGSTTSGIDGVLLTMEDGREEGLFRDQFRIDPTLGQFSQRSRARIGPEAEPAAASGSSSL